MKRLINIVLSLFFALSFATTVVAKDEPEFDFEKIMKELQEAQEALKPLTGKGAPDTDMLKKMFEREDYDFDSEVSDHEHIGDTEVKRLNDDLKDDAFDVLDATVRRSPNEHLKRLEKLRATLDEHIEEFLDEHPHLADHGDEIEEVEDDQGDESDNEDNQDWHDEDDHDWDDDWEDEEASDENDDDEEDTERDPNMADEGQSAPSTFEDVPSFDEETEADAVMEETTEAPIATNIPEAPLPAEKEMDIQPIDGPAVPASTNPLFAASSTPPTSTTLPEQTEVTSTEELSTKAAGAMPPPMEVPKE